MKANAAILGCTYCKFSKIPRVCGLVSNYVAPLVVRCWNSVESSSAGSPQARGISTLFYHLEVYDLRRLESMAQLTISDPREEDGVVSI